MPAAPADSRSTGLVWSSPDFPIHSQPCPFLLQYENLRSVGQERFRHVEGDLIDGQLLTKGYEQTDKRSSDGAVADDMNDTFIVHFLTFSFRNSSAITIGSSLRIKVHVPHLVVHSSCFLKPDSGTIIFK